jgi:hypothetical protein
MLLCTPIWGVGYDAVVSIELAPNGSRSELFCGGNALTFLTIPQREREIVTIIIDNGKMSACTE